MFEILGLIIVTTAIATLARGRGKSPVVAGCAAVVGYLAIVYGGTMLVPPGDGRLALLVAGWAWMGAIALYLRFVVGIGKAKPDGYWKCANCNTLNTPSAFVCDACQQPWQPKDENAAAQ